MNTKLNNWFIHPEYDNKYGVFGQCINFDLYLAEVVLSTRKNGYLSGLFYDESSKMLNDTSCNNGNKSGKYDYNFEAISAMQIENPHGMFFNPNERLDMQGLYWGGGSGAGQGKITGLIL